MSLHHNHFLIYCTTKRHTKNNEKEGMSPGLVVMGGDSFSKGRGFESWHRILDGHFYT